MFMSTSTNVWMILGLDPTSQACLASVLLAISLAALSFLLRQGISKLPWLVLNL